MRYRIGIKYKGRLLGKVIGAKCRKLAHGAISSAIQLAELRWISLNMRHKGRVAPRKRDFMWALAVRLTQFRGRDRRPDLLQTARPTLGLEMNRAAPVMALFVR